MRRTPSAKKPFDIGAVLRRIRAAMRPFPRAAMFALAEEGHDSLFEQLVACVRGVGPKCAHLALGIACGHRRVSVDVHVHRVSNRWGYIRAASPERTMEALERTLPDRWRIEINALLVPFGKHTWTGRLPKCSTCPALAYCRQVGVTAHR